MMKSTNNFAGILLLLSLQASIQAKEDSRFTQTLTEADRLSDTNEGKAYDKEFGKVVAPQFGNIVNECTKGLGPRINFDIVFVFGGDGRVQDVLTARDQPAAKCVGEKLRNLQLPAPPRAGWPIRFGVHISPDQGAALLGASLKLMATGTWEVDATLSRAFKMRIHGLLAGEDFDLTLEPVDRNAVRQIGIKDKVWASFDGGKTWKLQTTSEQDAFRRIYNFVHNPIRPDASFPELEVVDQQQRDGENLMHLRPKGAGKTKRAGSESMEYWFAINQDPKRNGVRKYEGPVTEPGHEKEPLHCVATYQPANDKTIQPPAGSDATPQQTSESAATPNAADSLKYSRDFYSKVHFVAITHIDFGGPDGKVDFKYDRYPKGGPERLQSGEGVDFVRKDGKTWLKSNDWGETGKPVDAQTAKRLNNWVGLVTARVNGEPASNDPKEGGTVMKYLRKESDNEREEFVFEESKEKPKSHSYPQVSFGRFKGSPNDPVLLSNFSGTMHLGQRDGMVKMDFSHLVAVDIVEDKSESASPPAEKSASGDVSLLDGKLKIDVPGDWTRDPDDPKEPKTLAKFSHEGEGGAWGAVLRGTHGLTPDKLDGYLKMRVAEYTKGFNWLPKDSHLEWLKKELVTIDGRKWADWRYVPIKKGTKDYRNNPVYTRFLTTSYKGQLLEIDFTSNLNTDPKLKEEIDHIMDSIHLEE